MATIEQYQRIAEDVAKHFGFGIEKIHDYVLSLTVPGTKNEVIRLIYDHQNFYVGVAFHVAVIPTDVVQVWEFAAAQSEDVQLMNVFFVGDGGEVFTGLDAQLMYDQDVQNKILEAVTKPENPPQQMTKEQQAEWELKQMTSDGKKPTFH